MGLKRQYIDDFFKSFKMQDDCINGSCHGLYMKEAIVQFLEGENKRTALDVYVTFFDSYKVIQGKNNFIDLLDILKSYEENAATLIDKQRDHYVHSVNVFLLGLAVYSQNQFFREIINKDFEESPKYDGKYDTSIEEFFFQWGIASLCHDIGYPVEIMNNQIKKFIKMISDVESKNISAEPYLAFKAFNVLNSVSLHLDTKMGQACYRDILLGLEKTSLCNPLDLLSYDIHRKLGTDLGITKEHLGNFLGYMQKSGFVDHGFYSAIIVLKWYSHIIEISNQSPDTLYYPILNSASAILLHNYYKNVLMKEPFLLSALMPEKHPIAYLLILCDELQEWNRQAYGIEDKKKVLADESRLEITDRQLKIAYLTPKGEMDKGFSARKKDVLESLIDVKAVFPDEIQVTSLASTDLYIETILEQDARIAPRPMLENIEKIAIQIHDDYNKKQLERNPNAKLEYPTWDSLPQSLKYSNIRQARAITDKIMRLGYNVSGEKEAIEEIKELTPVQVEYLAKIEHQSWMNERVENGWVYGKMKDVEKKISPYIVPYEELSEDIKELDRDAVRNMIPLLNSIGLKVYK